MFMAIAAVAMSVIQGISASNQKKAQNRLYEAQVEADNIERLGRNELNAAKYSFESYERSKRNASILEQGGEQYNEVQQAMAALQQNLTSGKFQSALQGSAELGALTALAAASGMASGSTQAAISGSLQFQRNLAEARAERDIDSKLDEGQRQASNIIRAAAGSMDNNYYIHDVDSVERKAVKGGIAGDTSLAANINWGQVIKGVGMIGDSMMQSPSPDYQPFVDDASQLRNGAVSASWAHYPTDNLNTSWRML